MGARGGQIPEKSKDFKGSIKSVLCKCIIARKIAYIVL